MAGLTFRTSSTRAWAAVACGVVASAAAAYAARRRRRGRLETVAGCRRCRRRRLVVDLAGDATALDVWVAGAPGGGRGGGAPLVVYVLDPEPVLFAAACLHVFSMASYFEGTSAEGDAEARYARMCVVGVGHAAEAFGLDGDGFDRLRLRDLRRRDFPPPGVPRPRALPPFRSAPRPVAEAEAQVRAPHGAPGSPAERARRSPRRRPRRDRRALRRGRPGDRTRVRSPPDSDGPRGELLERPRAPGRPPPRDPLLGASFRPGRTSAPTSPPFSS